MAKEVSSLARLRVSGNLYFVDLYLPEPVWKELTKRFNGNKLTVALKLEGEDGTTILRGVRPNLVRCCDCTHRNKMLANQGFSQSDKYCTVPANGQRLLNGMRSDQALTAWRKCPSFEWNGEKKEEA